MDPTNALLHRMRIRRLTGEQIRDAILAISGRLDRRVHGKSVKVHVTPFMRGNRSPGGSGPADGNGRRSLYVEVRRNHLSHFLTAFDKPVPFATIGKRGVSNSPAQPLILLNDEFVHKQAELWAKRLVEGNAAFDRVILVRAYVEAFGRVPESWEVEAAGAFIREGLKEQGEKHWISVWKDLFHVLFNVKEFVFIN